MIGLMSFKAKVIFLHNLFFLLHDLLDFPDVVLIISIGLHNRGGVFYGEDDSLEDSYEFRQMLVEVILEYRLWLVLVHKYSDYM